MTITNETSEVVYEGNGTTTVFPFEFLIPSDGLRVLTSDGAAETELISSQFTVTGLDDPNGGSVTYDPAEGPLPEGHFFIIQRAIPYTQVATFENQQRFFPAVLGTALDRLTMLTQQLQTEAGRYVLISRGSDATPQSAFSDLITARNEAVQAAAEAEAAENSLLKNAGDWATGTTYGPGDIVRVNGSSYICLVEHSSGNFQSDLSAGRWEIFAQAGAPGPGSGDMLAENNLSDVNSISAAQANLGFTPEVQKQVGEIFAVWDHFIGVSPPDNSGTARFIKLTAGLSGAGEFNAGLLINEIVSGSAPLVEATAEIATGPLAGETVYLANTMGAFLRPGISSGTLQFDQMQKLTGALGAERLWSGVVFANGVFGVQSVSSRDRPSDSGDTGNQGFNFDSSNSPDARVSSTNEGETRPKNVQSTYYMRIV